MAQQGVVGSRYESYMALIWRNGKLAYHPVFVNDFFAAPGLQVLFPDLGGVYPAMAVFDVFKPGTQRLPLIFDVFLCESIVQSAPVPAQFKQSDSSLNTGDLLKSGTIRCNAPDLAFCSLIALLAVAQELEVPAVRAPLP